MSLARQREAHEDRPEESRKACERDERKKLDAQDFEPAQLAANSNGDPDVHEPAGYISAESAGNGDSGDEYTERNRESGAADAERDPVEHMQERRVLRDAGIG